MAVECSHHRRPAVAKCLALIALAVFAGCELESSLKHRCQVSADCNPGHACLRNVCQDPGPPRPNYMFVTSRRYPTRFQPLAAADTACNDAADAAGLPGEYRAWLSTAGEYARDRVAAGRGWIRVDHAPFADTVDDITSGRIYTAASIDEAGHEVQGGDAEPIATGTNPFGFNDPGLNCNEWANDTAASVTTGITDATTVSWTSYVQRNCGPPMRIYCFGIDQRYAVGAAPAPAGSKIAFLTDAPFVAGSGFMGADSHCNQDAAAASLGGTFLAVVATTNFAVASRFVGQGRPSWVRVDGVPIRSAGADLFTGPLLAPLNVTSKGRYLGRVVVLTGGATAEALPLPNETCDNWTDVVGGAWSGDPTRVNPWFLPTTDSCSNPEARIFCLQQ